MNSGRTQSEPTESTSRSLLERAKACDPAAWQKISDVYSPLVYQWCRHAGLQSNDAADVAQEVFRSVSGAIGTFRKERPTDSFRGWLWTITKNKMRDLIRQRGDQPVAKGGTAAYLNLQQLPDEAPEDSDEVSSLNVGASLGRRAMAIMQGDFEERTWQAFWETTIEKRPAGEVAQTLGISPAAVYMAKSRILRRLRDEFAGLDLIE